MRTKLLAILILTAFSAVINPSSSFAGSRTMFNVEWVTSGLPIKVHLYMLKNNHGLRDSQTGIVDEQIKSLMTLEIDSSKVPLWTSQEQPLLIVIENTSNKPVDFSVAPHHTVPMEEAMNFKFFCLCNGHVYNIPSKGMWYRHMKLKADATLSAKDIHLKHVIFAAKKGK